MPTDHELDWWLQRPPILVPAPLSDVIADGRDIRGSRVVVDAAPGAGAWLYEQRAATGVHTTPGGDAVGVLTEGDYWRADRDDTYVAVPHAVPVEQVWLELPEPMDTDEPVLLAQDDIAESTRSRRLVPDPMVPPIRWPRRATTVSSVLGARCSIATPDGLKAGFRALTEPWRTRPGEINRVRFRGGVDGLDDPEVTLVITLTTDAAWHKATDTGRLDHDALFDAEPDLVWLD